MLKGCLVYLNSVTGSGCSVCWRLPRSAKGFGNFLLLTFFFVLSVFPFRCGGIIQTVVMATCSVSFYYCHTWFLYLRGGDSENSDLPSQNTSRGPGWMAFLCSLHRWPRRTEQFPYFATGGTTWMIFPPTGCHPMAKGLFTRCTYYSFHSFCSF